jgi:peroxiredoxin
MTISKKLTTGDTFPVINVNILDGSSVELGKARGNATWQMIVVYRGVHCPLCTRYLNQLEERKEALAELGVSVMAVSGDSKSQLERHLESLNISYPIAYGLTEEQMKDLGLYISVPRSEKETDHNFSEPGLFIVNEEGNLQAIDISNAPLLRPELDIIVNGIKFVRSQPDYPIRGTLKY